MKILCIAAAFCVAAHATPVPATFNLGAASSLAGLSQLAERAASLADAGHGAVLTVSLAAAPDADDNRDSGDDAELALNLDADLANEEGDREDDHSPADDEDDCDDHDHTGGRGAGLSDGLSDKENVDAVLEVADDGIDQKGDGDDDGKLEAGADSEASEEDVDGELGISIGAGLDGEEGDNGQEDADAGRRSGRVEDGGDDVLTFDIGVDFNDEGDDGRRAEAGHSAGADDVLAVSFDVGREDGDEDDASEASVDGLDGVPSDSGEDAGAAEESERGKGDGGEPDLDGTLTARVGLDLESEGDSEAADAEKSSDHGNGSGDDDVGGKDSLESDLTVSIGSDLKDEEDDGERVSASLSPRDKDSQDSEAGKDDHDSGLYAGALENGGGEGHAEGDRAAGGRDEAPGHADDDLVDDLIVRLAAELEEDRGHDKEVDADAEAAGGSEDDLDEGLSVGIVADLEAQGDDDEKVPAGRSDAENEARGKDKAGDDVAVSLGISLHGEQGDGEPEGGKLGGDLGDEPVRVAASLHTEDGDAEGEGSGRGHGADFGASADDKGGPDDLDGEDDGKLGVGHAATRDAATDGDLDAGLAVHVGAAAPEDEGTDDAGRIEFSSGAAAPDAAVVTGGRGRPAVHAAARAAGAPHLRALFRGGRSRRTRSPDANLL
ncbi:hypothetical protein ONE63_004514 [Megalurothrips usitatus]|uniref:Uncharacterized protein n=1 Tax=Megalurothrips usitatus TaxID=439358 RepID=A0AAV7X321_9NEOP|nr:hypothetical protein ONE63_004514 [Megalurothrips usitatus]